MVGRRGWFRPGRFRCGSVPAAGPAGRPEARFPDATAAACHAGAVPLLPVVPNLPIGAVVDELRAALAAGPSAVLVAPPGAGKTTVVPLVLADEPWATGRIVVLEPRRLAARAAAARLAALTGTRVGDVVGLRMRGETKVSARTRVEVVTEGVLVRMLHTDPALEGVSAVVFDEFHERSLDADVGLAFTTDVQRHLRPELRVVVMSATLAAEPVARLLDDARVVVSEGRLHPVRTVHHPTPTDGRWEHHVTAVVVEALGADAGDVLVFCPGAAEIDRVARLLTGRVDEGAVAVLALHGRLPQVDQDRALAPDPAGRRKVVLATSIAETSLTIDGVRIVVDGGLTRVPRFELARGMGQLVTVRVSRAAADQRRGRAGRQAPGTCHRLWSAAEDARLPTAELPEIAVADLAGLTVDLARWGDLDGTGLRWLDPPAPARLAAARAVLHDLAVVDGDGRLTGHGRRVADLPVHPRLGHLLVTAAAQGRGATGALVAAVLADRDPVRGPAARLADLGERLAAVRHGRGPAERTRTEARRLAALVGADGGPVDTGDAGALVALAYPERVAQLRPGSFTRYRMVNGAGAALAAHDPLAGQPYLAVAEADLGPATGPGAGGDARIRLAAPVTEAEVRATAGDRLVHERAVGWDRGVGDVVAERRLRLGALVLERSGLDPSSTERRSALLDGVRAEGLGLLSFTPAIDRWRARVALVQRTLGAPWPDLSDPALAATVDDWLGPHLVGARRRADLARLDLGAVLAAALPWPLPAQLDALVPERLLVPSGSAIAVDYGVDPPVLAVKLQELFGWLATPRVVDGRVPVTIHLLSPAGRPVQVTQDLASFWQRGYPDVRAELRGRYPRHPWPEDPLTALPTRHTTRRR